MTTAPDLAPGTLAHLPSALRQQAADLEASARSLLERAYDLHSHTPETYQAADVIALVEDLHTARRTWRNLRASTGGGITTRALQHRNPDADPATLEAAAWLAGRRVFARVEQAGEVLTQAEEFAETACAELVKQAGPLAGW